MENIVTVTKRARGESYEVECWAHVSGQTYRWCKHFNPDRETLAQMLEDFARYIRISARITDQEVRQAKVKYANPWREQASYLELEVKKEKEQVERERRNVISEQNRAEEVEKELKLKKSQLLYAMNDIGRLNHEAELRASYLEQEVKKEKDRADLAEMQLHEKETVVARESRLRFEFVKQQTRAETAEEKVKIMKKALQDIEATSEAAQGLK